MFFINSLMMISYFLLLFHINCNANYNCWQTSYCDTVAEAVDVINWSCTHAGTPCGCFPGAEYRSDGLISVDLFYYGWDEGLICNSTLLKAFGRIVDPRNCASSDPCCNDLDKNCRKLDPTAGNVHGDKPPMQKDPERNICRIDNENNVGAKAGR